MNKRVRRLGASFRMSTRCARIQLRGTLAIPRQTNSERNASSTRSIEMTRHRTVTWLLLSYIIAHCYGQDAAQNRLTLDELKASVNRERNGDPGNLIDKAAQSGERTFIPYIRTI